MVEDKIICEIKERYDINVKNYRKISRLMFRESLYFEDCSGYKYILKKYPKSLPTEDILSIVKLYLELEKYGIKTNRVVTDCNDVPFFEIANGKYILFTFLDGNRCSVDEWKMKVGGSLRELHNSMVTLNPTLAQVSTYEQVNSCIKNITRWEEIDELSHVINCMADKNLEICRNYNPFSQTIIHGDCTRNNCIIYNDKIMFIDFDNFKIGDPLEDVANVANSVIYDEEIIALKEKENIIKHIIYDYNLKKDDIVRMKNYMKINCIIELYKHREHYKYLRRTPGTKEYLKKLIYIIEYAVDEVVRD